MAFDTKNTFSTTSLTKDIVSTSAVVREGMLLVRTMEDGVEKVQPCALAGSQVPVGFSISDNSVDLTAPFVEEITVPAAADGGGLFGVVLQHAPRAHQTVGGRWEISLVAAGVELPQVATATAPGAGNFAYVAADQAIYFDTAQKGLSYTATYRYTLTETEAKMKFYERSINNQAGVQLGQVVILTGYGQIFTNEFDCKAPWGITSTPAVYSSTLGSVSDSTIAAGGTNLSSLIRVVHVPTSDVPALGLAFSFIP